MHLFAIFNYVLAIDCFFSFDPAAPKVEVKDHSLVYNCTTVGALKYDFVCLCVQSSTNGQCHNLYSVAQACSVTLSTPPPPPPPSTAAPKPTTTTATTTTTTSTSTTTASQQPTTTARPAKASPKTKPPSLSSPPPSLSSSSQPPQSSSLPPLPSSSPSPATTQKPKQVQVRRAP